MASTAVADGARLALQPHQSWPHRGCTRLGPRGAGVGCRGAATAAAARGACSLLLLPPSRGWQLPCGLAQQHKGNGIDSRFAGRRRGSPCVAAAPAAPAAAAAASAAAAAAAWAWPQLVPAAGPWGVWAGLICAGAFGMWAERNTRLGAALSGALVATLAGMALANVGYLPAHPREVAAVFSHVLPLAIPLLLLGADVRRIVRETGRLLAAFLLGAAATAAGAVLAMALFPLTPLGDEGWRIAAALTARHIGGAVNYMAVSESLGVTRSTFGAGLAADDLVLTAYFAALYALAARVAAAAAAATKPEAGAGAAAPALAAQGAPPAPSQPATDCGGASSSSSSSSAGGGHGGGGGDRVVHVYSGALALALSAAVCHVSTQVAAALHAPSQGVTIITALTVALATALPRPLGALAPSAEGLAALLMQVFFAAVGASANIALVLRTAPVLFAHSALALAAHLGLLLAVGRAAGFPLRELLLASNANIGGPSTVAGMAAAKGWRDLLVPSILVSTLGYTLGSAVGMALGWGVLRPLCPVAP